MNGALLHISLLNTSDLPVCPQQLFKREMGKPSCSAGTRPPGSNAVQTAPQILILLQRAERKRRASEAAGCIWPTPNLWRKAGREGGMEEGLRVVPMHGSCAHVCLVFAPPEMEPNTNMWMYINLLPANSACRTILTR